MRVCMIASGMTNSSLALAENLQNAGHKVGCFQLLFQGTRVLDFLELDNPVRLSMNPQRLSTDNIVYRYLSKDVPIYLQWVLKERRKLEKNIFGVLQRKINRYILKKLCRKYIYGRYDIINVIAYPRFFVDICEALSELQVPFFVTFHEVLKSHSEGFEILPFVRDILNYNTRIVLHSEKSKMDLIKLSDSDLLKRCSVIHFGPYEGNYVSYGDGVKCVDVTDYLLYFGNILPYKGLKYLYDAVCRIHNVPSLKIVVAGAGYDPVLDKMKKDSRFVLLNRYVMNEEIAFLISNCRAVVCPYIGGSQSGVVQMAMAYKKPIIASNVGAFSECIREGKNGWLVEPQNSEDMAEKITLLYNTKASKDLVYDIPVGFLWDTIVKEYEQLFDEILLEVK